jgi:hypothetical protein
LGECIEAAAEVYGETVADRLKQRVAIMNGRGDGGTYSTLGTAAPADFAATYGEQVCAELPTPAEEAPLERYSQVSTSVSLDLAYVLEGTVRAHVSPNKYNGVPGSSGYGLDDRPLEATRTGGAISDGANAIIIDDVQLNAVVRLDGESLLRYRQVIRVGEQCTAVRGHPCSYPSADFRTVNADGSSTGRTSSCQREAEHGGTWYDTDANITSLKPSSPFQIFVDTFYAGTSVDGAPPTPTSLQAFKSISVRAVHTPCDVGEPGYCPQDRAKSCTAPMPFVTFPVSRAIPSAGVVRGDLKPGAAGTATTPRASMVDEDRVWVEAAVPGSFDLLGFSGPEYLTTALVKDFKPLTALGDGYATAQVLLRSQEIPESMRKPDDAGPGSSRFENYGKTDMYFRCPAELVESEVVREAFVAPQISRRK